MAKNRNPEHERNPFKVVLYILIVLLLTGCIGFLFYENRQRKAAYREEIEEMASGETEYVRTERMSETEKQTEKQTEKKQPDKKSAAETKMTKEETESESESETAESDTAQVAESESDTEVSSESETETELESESESESETETELESESESESEEAKPASSENLQSIKIVVLNASGREGAAAMWRDVLEKGGYKTISVGNYSHKEEGTTIYTKNTELGDDLRSIFPNSNVYEYGIDEVKSEIELPGTVENVDDADAYIVVGKNNTEIF